MGPLVGLSTIAEQTKQLIFVILATWTLMSGPITSLLDAPSGSNIKDKLTALWVERKLAELTFVGLMVYYTPNSFQAYN